MHKLRVQTIHLPLYISYRQLIRKIYDAAFNYVLMEAKLTFQKDDARINATR